MPIRIVKPNRITANLADLNVGARPSRSVMRGGSTNSRPRSPTPDYNSNFADTSQVAGPSRVDAVQVLADQKSAKQARAIARKEKIRRRIKRHPDEYQDALARSKPNHLLKSTDAYGNKHRTTEKLMSHNSRFDLPEYQVVVEPKEYVRRVREYQ